MKVSKTLGAGVLSLGLVVGLAGFAGAASGTIDTTGPNSENEISYESSVDWDVENDNDLDFELDNEQRASSGEVEVEDNTTGGDATSGDAHNSYMVEGDVEIDNSGSTNGLGAVGSDSDHSATIENTGPRSENEVTFESEVDVNIDNDNDVNIDVDNEQSAYSGDAEVSGNTTGGSATSGSVSNTATATFNVRITN